MHPYRTYAPEPEPELATTPRSTTAAFAVLAFTGTIQLVISLVGPGQPSVFTLMGIAALVTALGWFARRRVS